MIICECYRLAVIRLMWDAIRNGNIEAVKQAIVDGADVNATEDSNGRTPLHAAASESHIAIVELLITKGADVNAREVNGWTPLHFSAAFFRKEIAELLIVKGADVNAKTQYFDGRDKIGYTPLDFARGGTADLLRKHGGKSAEPLKVDGQ